MGGQGNIMGKERNIHKTDRQTDRSKLVSKDSKSRLENVLFEKDRSKS
jgi:hypothetical protein